MPALSEYTNVYNTAVNILHKKGFSVWYDDKQHLFWAEREGWDFCSESPCGLLGLVAIYEYKKPDACSDYWWKDAAGANHMKLPRVAPKYTPVYKKE
jgi:hypothetical protein